MLTNPFPLGNIMSLGYNAGSQKGGKEGTPSLEGTPSNVYMMILDVDMHTRVRNYYNPEFGSKSKEPSDQ
jgi:hypothetical protein